jgi:predicted 3-demethylubiquinone-9 3-methyltransferase (glyoxalase superfamily)
MKGAVSAMNKITPFLWFDNNAEDAANFYLSLFPDARKLSEFRTPVDAGHQSAGALLTITLDLAGQPVTFLNGGPAHQLSEAFSFSVACDTQAEIDRYWAALTANGGKESQCGWLTDKFGLSWQIIPANIMQLLRHPAAMRAMMTMKKFDIAALEAAATG